jgi:hypothetical protein
LFREQGGLCYWCEEPCTLYQIKEFKKHPLGPKAGRKQYRIAFDADPMAATVDHLFDYATFDRHRLISEHGNKTVMACRSCNNMRGILDWRWFEQNYYGPFIGRDRRKKIQDRIRRQKYSERARYEKRAAILRAALSQGASHYVNEGISLPSPTVGTEPLNLRHLQLVLVLSH